MLDFDDYRNGLEYPEIISKSDKPIREDYDNNGSWGIALDEWEANYNIKVSQYNEQIKEYNERENRIEELFWLDLYRDLKWGTLPEGVMSSLRSYAYDKGHAHGFSEVYAVATGLTTIVSAYEHELYVLREKVSDLKGS